MSEQTAQEAIDIADRNVRNRDTSTSNSAFCLNEAKGKLALGYPLHAYLWAKESLSYSVGTSHPDYIRVKEMEDNV